MHSGRQRLNKEDKNAPIRLFSLITNLNASQRSGMPYVCILQPAALHEALLDSLQQTFEQWQVTASTTKHTS